MAGGEYPAHVARISDVVVAVFAAIAIALSAQKLNLRLSGGPVSLATRVCHCLLAECFQHLWLNLNFKHLPEQKEDPGLLAGPMPCSNLISNACFPWVSCFSASPSQRQTREKLATGNCFGIRRTSDPSNPKVSIQCHHHLSCHSFALNFDFELET